MVRAHGVDKTNADLATTTTQGVDTTDTDLNTTTNHGVDTTNVDLTITTSLLSSSFVNTLVCSSG
jgi:hypothetical protein